MATREEVYAKFGITAEAAQLFETELGTMLLWTNIHQSGSMVFSDPASARVSLHDLTNKTLGGLLTMLKQKIGLSDELKECFLDALRARNRLNHGFFEKHNFMIQTEDGCDVMLAELETLHSKLFNAWQVAGSMTTLAMQIFEEH